MASAVSHAIAAAALGTVVRPADADWRFWVLGAACAVVPDADIVGVRFGVAYDWLLWHRGLTHSLAFAAVLSVLVVATVFRRSDSKGHVLLYFFCAAASHGVLDALTNGGSGVAFFAPFSATRYFFPFRPIEVSPLGIRPFLTARGVAVLRNEMFWIWIPAGLFALLASSWRRARLARVPPN
jgi:inner membrane protein